MERNLKYILIFLITIFCGAMLSMSGAFLILNLFFLIICLYAFMVDKNILILYYIILLPTNGLYSTEYNLLRIFNPTTTSQFFCFLAFFPIAKTVKNLNKYQKIAILIIVSIILYTTYTDFKNAYFKIYDMDVDTAIRRIPKTFFRYGTLIVLIMIVYKAKIKEVIEVSLKTGVVFLVITALLTNILIRYGFEAVSASELSSGYIERYSGFFGIGDVNSLGGFLVITISYYLIKIKNKENIVSSFIVIIIAIAGIFYTASRTAFSGLIFVSGYYLLLNKNMLKSTALFAVLFLVIILVFDKQLEDILWRFTFSGSEMDVIHKGSRIWKWLEYIDYMTNYGYTFIHGTTKEFWLDFGRGFQQRRVAHNLYITMVFQAGIIPLSILILSYIKIIKLSLSNHWVTMLFTPLLFISMYISEHGYIHYFLFYLPLIYYKNLSGSNENITS